MTQQVVKLKDWLKAGGLHGFKLIEDGHWNALCRKWKLKNAEGFVAELFVVQDTSGI